MNLYIHIPYCLSKCTYCALYSETNRSYIDEYPELIAEEYRQVKDDITKTQIKTLYIGGGTPGLIGSDGFIKLKEALQNEGLDFSTIQEWTVELNPSPKITTPALLATLAQLGVNRLSFGAQSLNDETLRRLNRVHKSEDVEKAFQLARQNGIENVGLDLIAAYPGVTSEEWHETLDKAISLKPEHISVYSIIIEPETKLADEIASGKLLPPSPDEESDIILYTEAYLAERGFERYEISNYSKKGRACLHNTAVWQGEDYLGLGPSAASRIKHNRYTNAADIKAWYESVKNGKQPPRQYSRILTEDEDIEERFVYSLRTNIGLSPSDFLKKYPQASKREEEWRATLTTLAQNGITKKIDNDRWILTSRGREVADSAIEELLQ